MRSILSWRTQAEGESGSRWRSLIIDLQLHRLRRRRPSVRFTLLRMVVDIRTCLQRSCDLIDTDRYTHFYNTRTRQKPEALPRPLTLYHTEPILIGKVCQPTIECFKDKTFHAYRRSYLHSVFHGLTKASYVVRKCCGKFEATGWLVGVDWPVNNSGIVVVYERTPNH